MSFWDNITRSTLRDVARTAGVRTSPALAAIDLAEQYGLEPGPEFIDDMWVALRDGWLARCAPDRDAVVREMLAKGRGNTASLKLSTRAGQLAYLRTLRRGPGLTEVVLPILLASGESQRQAPVYAEAPASPEEQEQRWEESLRAGFASVDASNIDVFEFAVFATIAEGMSKLAMPVKNGNDEAARILSEVLNVFTLMGPQSSSESLLDYQRSLVERIPRHFANAADLNSVIAMLVSVLEDVIADPDATPGWASSWYSAVFWRILAFGEQKYAPEGFDEAVMTAQRRFLDDSQAVSASAGGLEGVMIELMATVPNVTAPKRIDNGVTLWHMFMGSAIVGVMLLPEVQDAPTRVMFQSPLVRGVAFTDDLADVMNSTNAKESMIKFYWLDDTVFLEQEVHFDDFSEPLFRYTLSRFAAAADYFDTVFRDRFGGSIAGADRKAVFDA